MRTHWGLIKHLKSDGIFMNTKRAIYRTLIGFLTCDSVKINKNNELLHFVEDGVWRKIHDTLIL